jgi:hypothetical protein
MNGLFLHTSWRSSGTWIWQSLRSRPDYLGFYEPLHEDLPNMSVAGIAARAPDRWRSRHPGQSSPYFQEYLPLLGRRLFRAGPRGVEKAEPGFAFSRFYMGADEQYESLRAYIAQLCEMAWRQGRAPVLKCTRTQGRFAWFKAQFPEAQHVLLIRQPWAQFCSAWRFFVEDANPYFLAVPFVVLARNAAHPDVAALIAALKLKMPPVLLPNRVSLMLWTHALRLLPPVMLYKAHLALWLLNALYALPAAEHVFDGDAPAGALAETLGVNIRHTTRPKTAPLQRLPDFPVETVAQTHRIACQALSGRFDPPVAARIAAWLATAEAEAERDLRFASIISAHQIKKDDRFVKSKLQIKSISMIE